MWPLLSTHTHTHTHRLFVQAHDGSETDKEAILLAYQVSKSVHSGEYPMVSMEKAVAMAATMTQLEHGDQGEVEGRGDCDEVAHEAIMNFCPWQLTHMALDHTLNQLKRKLVEHWKMIAGKSKEQCARSYIAVAQQWSHYGSTTFQAEVRMNLIGNGRTVLYGVVSITLMLIFEVPLIQGQQNEC